MSTEEAFTATNGIRIRKAARLGGGTALEWQSGSNPGTGAWHPIGYSGGLESNSHVAHALREYFQHERDERLGLWRHPDFPDMFVVQRGEYARVTDEKEGVSGSFHSELGYDGVTSTFAKLAKLYWEAHLPPRPWLTAQHGDVWLIKLETGAEIASVYSARTHRFVAGDMYLAQESEGIADAELLYRKGD